MWWQLHKCTVTTLNTVQLYTLNEWNRGYVNYLHKVVIYKITTVYNTFKNIFLMWNIFKVFIENLLQYCFFFFNIYILPLFYILFFWLRFICDLSSPTMLAFKAWLATGPPGKSPKYFWNAVIAVGLGNIWHGYAACLEWTQGAPAWLWPVTFTPQTLTPGAVCDLSRIVEEPELHPANLLSALRTRQLPAIAGQKQMGAETFYLTATKCTNL